MLRWRLILGPLFVAALVIVCWLDMVVTRPGAFLLPLALLIAWTAVVELLDMFNKRGRQPLPWVLYVGVLLTVAAAGMRVLWPAAVDRNELVGLGWMAAGLTIGLFLSLVGELQRYDGRWHTTVNLGLSAFAILYLGGLLGFIVQLRLLGGPTGDDPRWGMLALVSLIATVKMSDIGQYAVGHLLGRHKLAPQVSPGKTWEGAVGGVVFAVLSAWLVLHWGARGLVGASAAANTLTVVAFGIAVAVAGILGDLVESMLKREAGVKDSSTLLPGFGGVLDVLDSLLGAAPVAFLFWAAGAFEPYR
jgi:phosphatidate cytidylyltransferase